MRFTPAKIPDVILIEPQVFGDERGFFMETYHKEKFIGAGITAEFVQDNHSKSKQGILRGMHYQIKQPQGKLVRIASGEVFDVVVDMRKGSATFGQWVGEHLSAENKKMLWVPAGFAHGFYVISESAEFVYKCTDLYLPEYERSLQWNDATVAIEWPLIEGRAPLLSEKDKKAIAFNDAEYFL